jgi:hypothetical protein
VFENYLGKCGPYIRGILYGYKDIGEKRNLLAELHYLLAEK